MKKGAFALAGLVGVFLTLSHEPVCSQETYYLVRPTNGVPRYNVVPSPAYRHAEDIRRFNALPDPNGYKGREKKFAPRYVEVTPEEVPFTGKSECCEEPIKLRTEIVNRRCQPVVTYDACGCRVCRTMTVTLYKDVYSNGRSRIWQHVSYS